MLPVPIHPTVEHHYTISEQDVILNDLAKYYTLCESLISKNYKHFPKNERKILLNHLECLHVMHWEINKKILFGREKPDN